MANYAAISIIDQKAVGKSVNDAFMEIYERSFKLEAEANL